mmetsp:Transcript_62860/g.149791  ORF Transcript_62860/g.149791 Transcript_62860/m.149791 type:complete len:289 (+) Transcript_62860:176-1042(+)|eukprot:CAMPEP_0180147234 /NCGR_PEP_ID=MMETSP0986-20121125/19123_1 /TAXON_ID=697907 /ORGANISM="non described non described, Strain CCMP2293" /LENGTH=288 /DNA_ID=CAMNT_0022092721 /DNA_START=126 /DNA_END=992 /DNA_ORIENTATION=+
MAATLEEYRDILIADTYVDLARLKMRAQHGIPSEIRAEVWKYLLDVSKPDKSEEVSTTKRLAENYWDMTETAQNDVETLRSVKLQLRSYTPQWEAALDAKSRKMIERIAVCFLYHNTFAECSPSVAFLLPPVLICTQEESDAFYCFQGLMVRVITHMPEQDMKLRVARFVMLFKTIYPDINAALEEEEVEVNEWAVSWLRFLLCRELPVENSLRLWDSYFAADQPQDGLLLHPYVCLAILEHLQGTIIELSERSEILMTLQHLPPMDMDQIITQAQSIRDEVDSRKLL